MVKRQPRAMPPLVPMFFSKFDFPSWDSRTFPLNLLLYWSIVPIVYDFQKFTDIEKQIIKQRTMYQTDNLLVVILQF